MKVDELAETAPRKPYVLVEGNDPARFYLRCNCGQIIKKRKDAFIPNLHVAICLACHNISTVVEGAVGEDGKVIEPSSEAQKQAA